MMDYLMNLWSLFVEMSFYIVIGLIFTGLLHAFVKKDIILKQIGKKSTASVIKASVLGVPLPLCSCGVVPTAMYLGKNGGSKGAVISFLTSTPQTGIDSIIATYGLMGPLFAGFRVVAAFFSGIFAGIVTNIFCKNDDANFDNAKTSCACSTQEPSCCSESKEDTAIETCGCASETVQVEETSCCATKTAVNTTEDAPSCGCASSEKSETNLTFMQKLKSVFTFAFGEFLDEFALNFVIGLLIAALISTAIPEEWLSGFTNPIFSMITMLIIGIPMYICSTASIPVALSLIVKGISPGAAFVFLFAGPITNIASLTILAKTLGRKVLIIYLSCAAFCAIVFGLILDYIIDLFNYTGIETIASHAHEHGAPLYMVIIAVIFGLLVIKSLFNVYIKKRLKTKA